MVCCGRVSLLGTGLTGVVWSVKGVTVSGVTVVGAILSLFALDSGVILTEVTAGSSVTVTIFYLAHIKLQLMLYFRHVWYITIHKRNKSGKLWPGTTGKSFVTDKETDEW